MIEIKTDKNLSTITKRHHYTEARLCAHTADLYPPPTTQKTVRLAHLFEDTQIELALQNEQLHRASQEFEESLHTYSEIYDYAPVGYLTFSVSGLIHAANHTGAQLLGVERGLLINRLFGDFLADEGEKQVFYDHLRLVLHRKVMLRCEIRLTGDDGTLLYCKLQSIAVTSGNKTGHILSSLVDDTVRRQFEIELHNTHGILEKTVQERTKALTSSNGQLMQEIEDRKKTEESLQMAYSEIKQLKKRLQAENVYLQKEVAGHHNFGELIGTSKALSHVFSLVEQVAPINATVLLLGETGTGKGVVARAIHGSSSRKNRQMITVNCAALPNNLIESELFGREKGAFTGSDSRQIGRFELADGGTLFLDEIGDLPLDMQCKLLRVIQDGELERLGSSRTVKVDVRIIAATNRNLQEEVRKGTFRADLFYRLNVFPVTIPPLRQRKEDIPLLVNHFVTKFNKKNGKKIETMPKACLSELLEYHWPGNVRELESVIERAVIVNQGCELQLLDRFSLVCSKTEQVRPDAKPLVELEHDHIVQMLKKTGWRIEGKNGAALLLGLNPSTLRARMRKYNIFRT